MYEDISMKSVLIEITNACNLKCIHCFNMIDRACEDTKFMSVSNIEKIIEKCHKKFMNKVYLSGGEPLLHPNIFDIIELCGTYKDVQFVITTNGLSLDDKLLAKIESYNNIGIQISVDGITKDTYEAQRGFGTYNLFIANLTLFKKSKVKQKIARTCITRLNYKEVPAIYEYLYQSKITPTFLFVNILGNAKVHRTELSLSLAQKLSVIDKINKLNNYHNFYVSPPEPVSACNFTEQAEVKSFLVKYTGEVAPCQYFYTDSIGNIFDQEIDEILNYENLKTYYELAEKRKCILESEPSSPCQTCKIQEVCRYGCIGMASLRGDLMGTDGECGFRLVVSACYSSGLVPVVNDEIKKKYTKTL